MSLYVQCARCKAFIPSFLQPFEVEWTNDEPRIVHTFACEPDLEPGTIVHYTGPMEKARLDMWELQDIEGDIYVLKCGSMVLRVAKSHVKRWEG